MPEVNDQAQFVAGRFQIVLNLSSMLVSDFFDSFDLNDNFSEADKIRDILFS